jgi:hypothetical protein
MRDTRLIFIEGIMGAGKSTTAAFLTDQLPRNGIAARFMLEGPRHPLRVATDLPHPNAAWRDLTVDDFIERSVGKWGVYVQEAHRSTTVTVCDGLLFHGNLTDVMLMDAAPEELYRYVERVIERIQILDPVVIYFTYTDVRLALRRVCDARGAGWEAYQVNWKVPSPYGVRRSLSGFDGLVQIYEAYSAMCDNLFARLPIPKLRMYHAGDWATHYRDILAFLRLPAQQIDRSLAD